MASLDWSQCPAVTGVPGKRSGAWVFRGARTPVSTVFENLQDMNVDEFVVDSESPANRFKPSFNSPHARRKRQRPAANVDPL
jgi:hypothetical protein